MEGGKAKVTFQLANDFEEEKQTGFLVNFSNGQLLPSAQGKPKFTLYQKTKDRSQKKRLIVAETDYLTYVGSNYDQEALLGGAAATKYCVGELDREKGTITLHKAELVTLKPYIPGKTDIVEEAHVEATPVKSGISLDHVVTSFGSEKQKKRFSAAKRNKVETTDLESALATAVVHCETMQEKAEAAPVESTGIIPLHNPLAEVPQDVYKLEDIVLSLSAISSLEKAAKFFKSATTSEIDLWRQEKRYPNYILEHVSTLPSTEPQSSLKAAILLGLCCLMKMHNTPMRGFQKTGLELEGVDLPNKAREEILEKFTEKQSTRRGLIINSLSARMKDKIRLHLFVLALILDDFTVDCQTLQQDLKLSCARVMDHFRALGCSVSKKARKRKSEEMEDSELQVVNSCIAILKIPLNFPKPKSQKKSRK